MPTNTYVALATQTLGSAAASVTFSSISSAYTDLVIVAQPLKTTAGGGTLRYQVNSDSGTNYSNTTLYGDGSTAGSDRASSAVYGRIGFWTGDNQGNTLIANFQNYSNTTTYKNVLSRTNNLGSLTGAVVNLWRSTSAITSIYIYNDGGNFATGSTFSLYGIASSGAGAKATGGTVTSDANYYYHTFLSSGTFTPTQTISADMLCIAGGGGAGDGGGGAGGVQTATTQTITNTSISITIGGGGTGGLGNSTAATIGNNSVITSYLTANGGGPGQTANVGAYSLAGGSGGGSIISSTSGGTGSQGSAGGKGYTDGLSYDYGGGGGGYSAAAGDAAALASGTGGNGLSTYSSWGSATSTGENVSGTYWYAGGGSGGGGKAGQSPTIGAAGYGGGGKGAYQYGTPSTGAAGTANTGGGGGGGSPTYAGAGGSGIVIVRYAK